LDELRTFLRVSDEEMDQIARVFAEKLNKVTGPASFLFPGKGWSALDPPDGHMFDKEQDRLFLTILKEKVGPHLSIREVDANLEDAAFADEVVKACIEIFPRPERK
jgi:uncharacterized protein (UPF0261 family)